IYIPFAQNTWPNALRLCSLVVKTDRDPHLLISGIRRELRGVDPTLPVSQIKTMEEVIVESLAQRRFNTALLAVFAGVAALLAAVGIYGVMSYSVSQRTHEMGVRMALGAKRADIVGMVAISAARMAALGIAIGIGLSLVSAGLLAGLLFGVSPTDP